MNRRRLYLAYLLLASMFAAVMPVLAQSPCGIGYASPLNQFANVRGIAGDTTRTPIATVRQGTSVPVASTQTVRGNETWFGLCSGGYVSGAVVRFNTNTPTLAATRTPIITPIPTRVTGTQAAGKWYRVKESAWFFCPDGVTQSCGVPIEFEIYSGTASP
jgi:hypothetical protein